MVMLLADSSPLLLGLLLAVIVMAVGGVLGFRLGRSRRSGVGNSLNENDRERLLQLLRELGVWTQEYSGNVSDYQDQLGRLNEAVKISASRSPSEARMVTVLEQIMESNSSLKTRLDAAEQQLEKQTRQIASYLTEARTDGLTGLFNRRALDQRLEEIFIAYRNGGRSFVVALVDVDKFKLINDNYGHQTGDQVLKQLASVLRTQLANAIMVARFGGEEFAVVMDGPLRIAAAQLNEVRKRVAELPIQTGTQSIDVTISIGLSEPREDIIVAPVLRRADEALYAAKNIGRNRVYYHDGRDPILVGAPEVVK